MLDGSDNTSFILTVVACVIILLLVIACIVLFAVSVKSKKRSLKGGLKDDELSEAIVRKADTMEAQRRISPHLILEETQLSQIPDGTLANSPQSLIVKRARLTYRPTYEKANSKRESNSRAKSVLWDVLIAIVALVCFAVCGLSCYSQFVDSTFHIGDTDYIVVSDSSMQSVDSSNLYIEENGLDDRIDQWSLIGLDTAFTDDDIELYDIVAINDADGNIVVHRVVNIYETTSGSLVYQLRGDANENSAAYEVAVTSEEILGLYDGYQSYALGVTVSFVRSYIGISVFLAVGIIMVALLASRESLASARKKRYLTVAESLDREPELEPSPAQ